MPDFPLIDTHVHLYHPGWLAYSWLSHVPAINRPHLVADFDAATGGVAIEAFVFVEVAVDAGRHIDEAAFVADIATREPRLKAMVAHAPVEKGAAVEADLEALLGFPSLRGIRRLIQGEANAAMCIEPGFVDGVRRLAAHGLHFELCIRHWQMVYAMELAKRCPNVRFVLDHIGKPDIRNGLTELWWSQMRELARLPNVVCKISGAIGEAGQGWTAAQVAPYVRHAIDCFGFERSMFGSDWSVSELTHRYGEWVDLVDHVIAGCSAQEREALYRETAKRAYRI